MFALPEPLVRIIRATVLGNGLHTPAIYAFLDVLKSLGKSMTATPARSAIREAFGNRLGTSIPPEIGAKQA